MNNRQIVHMDLDTFFVSVERLHNKKLIDKPVIIGGASNRGVVASCSYETRGFGVHSAMPMRMARTLCPEAIIVRGDMDEYSKFSNIVTDIIAEKAPIYEKTSIDEHYIDVTGMDRFFGCYKWSKELREKIIKETHLPISFGLSVNKTVSKIATGEAKPNKGIEIPEQKVLNFIHPLSIKKMPMIGEKTYRQLFSMGVDTIGLLSKIPPEVIEKVLGKNGITIWKKANGIDSTPVEQYSSKKSISTECTFDNDIIDTKILNDTLISMVEKLCYELRSKRRLTSCVTIKIRYANFDTHTLQKRISYTSFDHHLSEISKELFNKIFQRRMRVRLIGVKFSHLVQGVQQLDMFEDVPKMVNLYLTWDKLRNKYGQQAVKRAVSI